MGIAEDTSIGGIDVSPNPAKQPSRGPGPQMFAPLTVMKLSANIGPVPSGVEESTAAVVDALSPFGITHLDIPLTPEKVWRAIEDAG